MGYGVAGVKGQENNQGDPWFWSTGWFLDYEKRHVFLRVKGLHLASNTPLPIFDSSMLRSTGRFQTFPRCQKQNTMGHVQIDLQECYVGECKT
jgi:hypothetical protein